jgi:hypothetical protein
VHSVAIAEDNETLIVWVDLSDGALASVSFKLDELLNTAP